MKRLIIIPFALLFTFLLGCKEHIDRKQKPIVSEEELLKVNKYLVDKDSELIDSYAKRRNWNMSTTGSGLRYMIFEKGSGRIAVKGKYAEIKYNIELLDGTKCYNSDSLGLKKFLIGKGDEIPGLEEGILLLREGDKAHFIMPPHLAFQLLGDEKRIPARAIIVYDVELLKISDN